MGSSLVICGVCSRHVRAHETRCPFCKSERAEAVDAVATSAVTRRMGRAMIVAIGLAATGCAGSATDRDSSTDAAVDNDVNNMAVRYGLPAPVDAGDDDVNNMGLRYGAPPNDQ
jgi:hypothetical protein